MELHHLPLRLFYVADKFEIELYDGGKIVNTFFIASSH